MRVGSLRLVTRLPTRRKTAVRGKPNPTPATALPPTTDAREDRCYDERVQAQEIAHARARRLRRREYDRMVDLGFFEGEHVELIHGTVVQMSPIGPPHSAHVDRLNELLLPKLIGRATVRIQQPFLAADESEPEPDVAVVPHGSYDDGHPDRAFLVVEVAETSLDYDRDTKAPLYAASGVPEYWIVDIAGRAVEVHRDLADGRYRHVERFTAQAVLRTEAFSDLEVPVADLLRQGGA